jgi:hypothetical protein
MPFEQGKSGNPEGGPPWTARFSTIYNKLLAMTPEELEAYEPKTMKEKMCKDVILKHDDYKEIADRVDGKPKQTIENTGEMSNVLTFTEVAARKHDK